MTGLEGIVLITGGAGFLGRGIMRYAQENQLPAQFIVYSRDQQKHAQVYAKYTNAKCVIGDILDTSRLADVMAMADVVIHAAALKHLPECEAQPSQALHINVDGTRSVMDAAAAAGVKRVVCISTDKAAAPLNTYGMTKAIVERLVFETLDYPSRAQTTYNACRYGNVIGSTGSIWPVFKKQAQTDNHLSVTDPDMTRFFIDINQAVEVVVAALQAPPGTVVIPQPEALNIGKLADYLTDRWELDAPHVVGLRPGEKSHENMIGFNELDHLSQFDKYFLLNGPLHQPQVTSVMSGLASDTARPLAPEDFYLSAVASEAV